MTRSSPRPVPRNLRIAASLFLAVTLGGMTPARAGLDIIAIAGDISEPSPNIVGGGNITTIFEQAALNRELAYPNPGQEWTLEVTCHWGMLDPGLVAQFTNPILDRNGRIIAVTITFNNLDTPGISWFADPTRHRSLSLSRKRYPPFTRATTSTSRGLNTCPRPR